MRPLFSTAGRKALSSLPVGKTLIAFDFDGTLAPLVRKPEKAFTFVSLLPTLKSLSKYSPVAVITGRGLKDVESRLRFRPDFLVGNHGLEGLEEFASKRAKAKKVCAMWVRQLNRSVAELPKDHGIFVEDKKHSLSLHYREAKNVLGAQRWLEQQVDNLWPQPRVILGKLIFNLIPQGSPHKGSALKTLMRKEGCTHAIFVGDDITDEDVFAEKGRILSVRVGKLKGSKARFYLRGQRDMGALLKALEQHFKA